MNSATSMVERSGVGGGRSLGIGSRRRRTPRWLAAAFVMLAAMVVPVAGAAATPGPMVKIDGPQEYADFGWSIDADGDTMVVGAMREGNDQGAAYVYVRDGNGWVLQARLVASDAQQPHWFGMSVAIEGDSIVVGAPLDDDLGTTTGAVYVFTRSGATWTEQAQVYGGHWLGEEVDISGDTIAASSVYLDENRGAVYTFTGSGASWVQEAVVQPDDVAPGDRFGRDLDLDGDALVVRSMQVDKAYIFERGNAGWAGTKLINPLPDPTAGAWHVALDGDTALVAQNTGYVPSRTVAVNVFVKSGGVWSHQATLPGIAPESGPLALDGNIAVAGYPFLSAPANRSGAIGVFRRSGAEWMRSDVVAPSPATSNGAFGRSAAVIGEEAFVGAPGTGIGGAAYVADITPHGHLCAGLLATIVGTPLGDDLEGTPGNDVIQAFQGDDVIDGRGGDDTICAGSGDDSIEGGPGNDVIHGQAGDDTIVFDDAKRPVTVKLPLGTSKGQGKDTFTGVENIIGSSFADTLIGDDGPNQMASRGGSDKLNGGAGDDILFGAGGGDTLIGGPGDDQLWGGKGVDTASYATSTTPVTVSLKSGTSSGEGSDTLGLVENVSGGAGDDTIEGSDAGNKLTGNGGADVLLGGRGMDTLLGNSGDDTIKGGHGDDVIDGHDGDDALNGGNGADTLRGWSGNDTFVPGGGNDVVKGGAGDDTVNFASTPDGMNVDLAAGTATGQGSDSLVGVANVVGSRHDDEVAGNGSPNHIIGGEGDDIIFGRGGDDDLDGGKGDDAIVPGPGADQARGGVGIDLVSYFDAGGGVKVDLSVGTATGQGVDALSGFEWIEGSEASDTLIGRGSNNLIAGNGGDDLMRGQGGLDFFIPGSGDDRMFGDSGYDAISLFDAAGPVVIDIGAGRATGHGFNTFVGVEDAEGSAFSDTLRGDAGSNLLVGLDGNDRIEAQSGSDFLYGDAGYDTLDGGPGYDECYAGEVHAGCDVILSAPLAVANAAGREFWSSPALRLLGFR